MSTLHRITTNALVDAVVAVCWFSLIWKNRLVELAGKGSGHTFRAWTLYRLASAELRFPLLCSALVASGWAAGCSAARTGRWQHRRCFAGLLGPTGRGHFRSGRI